MIIHHVLPSTVCLFSCGEFLFLVQLCWKAADFALSGRRSCNMALLVSFNFRNTVCACWFNRFCCYLEEWQFQRQADKSLCGFTLSSCVYTIFLDDKHSMSFLRTCCMPIGRTALRWRRSRPWTFVGFHNQILAGKKCSIFVDFHCAFTSVSFSVFE